MPRVSVILPVHRGAATLRQAADSILRQTFGDFELLLVENGSRDATPQIAQAMADEDSRVRVLRLPQAGLVDALNAGLAAARGALIARMDADDVSHARRLEQQVAHLDARPATGLVSCLVRHVSRAARQAGYAAYVDWINALVTHEQIALHRFVESPLAHPSVVFRRQVAERHGAWRQGRFPEDYELWLRWLEAGVRMEKVSEVLLDWGDSPDRLSRTDSRYSARAFFACKAEYLQRWLEGPGVAGRPIWFWGAGRETRRRLRPLMRQGMPAAGWVDIDPEKWGKEIAGLPVIAPEQLPRPDRCFVVSCVTNRGAREEIQGALQARGFVHGRDFVLAG